MAVRILCAIGATVCLVLALSRAPAEVKERHPSWDPRWDARAVAYETAIPDDTVLLEQLHDAIDLRRRESFDRVLDAREAGELIEHATLTEAMYEHGTIAIDTLFIVGDEFFNYLFRPENGWGRGGVERTAVGFTPHFRRVHDGAAGGPDAFACMSCHFKGGPDGAGTQTQNAFLRGDGGRTARADQRNAPHLLGLGPIAVLAREMSAELRKQADRASAQALAEHHRVEVPLSTKGVSFGRIAAEDDGELDLRGVEGVDQDLVVRPFGWKGHQATLRGIAEESLHLHQGLLSMGIQQAVHDGKMAGTPFGSGKEWHDLDDDGVSFEVDSGMLTTLVGYLAQLEAPVVRPPRDPAMLDMFAAGRGHFESIGCAGCHVPTLELSDPLLDARLEPGVTPKGPVLMVNVAKDGDGPKIEPMKAGEGTPYLVHLFSDLKRHDMGESLASPAAQGTIPARVFLTRPLWGLAFTAPYLHDGRAPTVHDAIVRHDGEAAAARDRYLALDESDRADIRVFLVSLSRKPKVFVP